MTPPFSSRYAMRSPASTGTGPAVFSVIRYSRFDPTFANVCTVPLGHLTVRLTIVLCARPK